MSIITQEISTDEAKRVLGTEEGHFSDLKSKEIAPNKLTRTIAAFANADGGEIFIGITEDKAAAKRSWVGFADTEEANGHIQAFESLFPLGDGFAYSFLKAKRKPGVVLRVEVSKSKDIKCASDGIVYSRRGAQNLPVKDPDAIARLKRAKGLTTFETETLPCDKSVITESNTATVFIRDVIPTSTPEVWMKKQQVLISEHPTVAGAVLFADEPQAVLPKRSGMKLYRYKTTAKEGTREALAGQPVSIDGNAYEQISEAIKLTTETIESVRINTPDGLEPVRYPTNALHEVITNAVLHRDYSLIDDIHIRIFDNRVEVVSPGSLPAHITPENILEERFSRNPIIVRLINKFPNPPNKDVGEGLNTTFAAMREMKLKDPLIEQETHSVKVTLRHESLASPEEIVLEFLTKNPSIKNGIARKLCFIGSENKMKVILQRMVRNGLIELVPGTTRYSAAYKLVKRKR
jgi:ATP-dependent DNA helicase RecG